MKISSTMMNDVNFERRVKDAFAYWTVVEQRNMCAPACVGYAWEDFCLEKTLEGELEDCFNFLCNRLNIEPEVLDEGRKHFSLSFFSEEEKE